MSKHYANEETYWRENHLEADSESHELSMKSTLLKDACFKSLLLEYTAGCEPEKMIALLACLVEKYESRQLLLSKYDGRINIAPLAIDDLLDQYEEFIQVLSLCILLDQPDLLVRFVGLFDRAEYFGSDALYEDLLTKVVPGRSDVDTWYHSEYSKLLYAIYADTSDEASRLLEEYCDEWYSSFRQAPWHDLHIGGDTQGYVGYWAFEAAAVAYL
ncbi:PoNe immunity protein domain-containing protein [Pseudomonas baltica]|uniref:PoNe immunity protein domain-containing protein n=1 Tax=Pseudomonas baltica TaxID=2762576 RepID=UPI00289F23FD|nr:PoNe immunity protein domain-containing protein [Pseudomonas baltica]